MPKRNIPSTLRLCLPVLYTVAVVVGADSSSVIVKRGEPVTLIPDVETNHQKKTVWYYEGERLALISNEDIKICIDAPCKEKFEGRLKVDPQTRSLTITDTRTTDSGVYEEVKIGNGDSLHKKFNVTISEVQEIVLDPGGTNDSLITTAGPSTAAVVGMCVCAAAVLILFVALGLILYRRHQQRKQEGDIEMQAGNCQVAEPLLTSPTQTNQQPVNGPDVNSPAPADHQSLTVVDEVHDKDALKVKIHQI